VLHRRGLLDTSGGMGGDAATNKYRIAEGQDMVMYELPELDDGSQVPSAAQMRADHGITAIGGPPPKFVPGIPRPPGAAARAGGVAQSGGGGGVRELPTAAASGVRAMVTPHPGDVHPLNVAST
jgi:hypothetical protein